MADDGPCIKCRGRGWIVSLDAGSAGSARRCDCRLKLRRRGLERAAEIPERYRDCTLDNFQVAGPEAYQLQRALSHARHYVDEFWTASGPCETGLMFVGPPGVGKTHLAVAVLRELTRRFGVSGRFLDFVSLIDEIQGTFDPLNPGSKQRILDPLRAVDVLVLDDLGAQKPTPFVSDVLYLIINSRYSRRLPTIFTTNYSFEADGGAPVRESELPLDRGRDPEPMAIFEPDALSSRVPRRLLSRLFEMARPVELDTVSDYRQEVRMQHLRAPTHH